MPSANLRRAALICNRRSRRGAEWFDRVRSMLSREGFHLVAADNFRDPKLIRPRVDRMIQEGVPLVIVGGGDGTMSSTAGAFKGRSSVMGVLPLGTGNAFARDLGIPADAEGACRILIEGTARSVDLGIASGRHFVNVATVGLTTRIAEELTDEGKRRFGRLIYAFAIVRAVAAVRPFRATLKVRDEEPMEFETMQIVFGSGRFHAGPFPVTPDAEITDRLLHGYALRGSSKGALIKMALRLWGGRHVDLPEVQTFSLRHATLETLPPRRVVIDGEICERTPIELSIDPAAIRVMTAPDLPGAESPPAGTHARPAQNAPVDLH